MKKLKTQFDQNSLRPSLATPSCCCCCSCCSCVISTITTSVLTSRSLYINSKKISQEQNLESPTKKILYTLLGIVMWPGFLTVFFILFALSIWLAETYFLSYDLTLPLLGVAPIGYGVFIYFVKKDLKVTRAWVLKETLLPPLFFIIEFILAFFVIITLMEKNIT